MKTERPFLKVGDVAGELGVSNARVYQMAAAHELPFCKVGGRLVVPRAAWTSWLQSRSDSALASARRAED
jgi:excisionase family DNA binding protein